jgi:hypothetical protein
MLTLLRWHHPASALCAVVMSADTSVAALLATAILHTPLHAPDTVIKLAGYKRCECCLLIADTHLDFG